jgi:hypothetical protein
MTSRDLKIAGIITAACLLLSFGASYSYVRGWYLSKGVLPLALTVILVLLSTIILETFGGASKVALAPITGTPEESLRRKHRESLSAILLHTEALLSPVLLVILLIIQLLLLIRGKAKQYRLQYLGRAHG